MLLDISRSICYPDNRLFIGPKFGEYDRLHFKEKEMTNSFQKSERLIMDAVEKRLDGRVPKTILLLGSGLNEVEDDLESLASFPYESLPGFPTSNVLSHNNRLVLGRSGKEPVICLSGRVHYYEGPEKLEVWKNVLRFLRRLGAERLFLTAAVGSLRAEIKPGELVLISDQINFTGWSPLIGPNDDAIGPRFLDVSNIYDSGLRKKIRESATAIELDLHEGVYTCVVGPCFETKAEARMLAGLGGDIVGMSVVPEAIIGRHCGYQIAGLAVVTNYCPGLSDEHFDHDSVISQSKGTAKKVSRLVKHFLQS